MNQKQIGIMIIIAGILLSSVIYLMKLKEDKYIDRMIEELGGCYLSDGTCLHTDRDFTPFLLGWAVGAALIILGIYLQFDKTQEILAMHQVKVSNALNEAKKKDEFSAYLAGFEPDEQKIIKAIHDQDGIKQSTLRYRTGLSKTGLSLMLKNLEAKGIVSKKPSGKTNQLFLKKRF